MENCLVTKLKANINRDDLHVLGTLRYYFESGDGVYPFYPNLGEFIVKGKVEFKFDDNSNQFTRSNQGEAIGSQINFENTSNGYVHCKINKAGWLSVKSKYNIEEMRGAFSNGIYCRTNDFKGMNLTYLRVLNCMGDIKEFDINNVITNLELLCDVARGYKEGTTYGDITNISKYTKLQILAISRSSIKGNIEDLYPLVESTSINITNCKQIFGDIKILADKMYQAGRKSGTLKIWTAGKHIYNTENVTYNGEYFTNRVWTIVFSEDGHSDENTTE